MRHRTVLHRIGLNATAATTVVAAITSSGH
jgi:hypothetical protein